MNKIDEQIKSLLSKNEGIGQKELEIRIKDAIEKLETNFQYRSGILGEIILSSQEFSYRMRKFISNNSIDFKGDIWKSKSTNGKLLNSIKCSGKIKDKTIELLWVIIQLRNWAVHDIYKEESNYINKQSWNEYYFRKLAVTKLLISEAIDYFDDVDSIID